ncbi:nuclear nucleic acid-binding protein C1D-like [Planococcus citri]|uniref:nuclear nucleic acid-binding protein C1D-like n=1 Tax=Planococcus citri TaxID=170843 RepID=UPI0031F8EBED
MSSSEASGGRSKHLASQFGTALEKVSEVLNFHLEKKDNDDLSVEDKARQDLFLAYALNCFMWMYMRTNGEDPSQTVLKTELNKVKENMAELQRAIDRKTIMPRIDQGAAKRFIEHGLWEENNPKKSKHTKFEDD